MKPKLTGSEIRQSFIDFFEEQRHTFVPSASLVPGGDATLLFTNAGMVQFKDVFLGTDQRPYSRAVNSQKCLRVAGKHNDLDEVGRDDFHHTFFEMLGNWSFGDYYKQEAIGWAWQLLTDVWGLPKDRLFATCFKDDKGNIPTDDEAADIWRRQPGIDPERILFFGRKENFWEMAETGPCGPCSEIHIDRGEEYDDLAGTLHRCGVNGECKRYLEIWNNVFIQYNRIDKDTLEPLPAKHVDTGMGFERIVSVIQEVDSNYKTDLFQGILGTIRQLTEDSPEEMYANFTPYRVVADHTRAASFLIADGVVPGNIGRNYICRMIIRRAARFGTKIGLREPFLAKVATTVIQTYGEFYPELLKNKESILDNLTREEIRFARTVESGTAYLQSMLDGMKIESTSILDGKKAFDLYATYGLPLEIARDIAREQSMDIDEAGFKESMEAHRLASGGGKAMGSMGGENVEFYSGLLNQLVSSGVMGKQGVQHNPYEWDDVEDSLLAMVAEGRILTDVSAGDHVEAIVPRTGFYIESGGQVSDTGWIRASDGSWEIEISEIHKPAAGMITHIGEVLFGHPKVGDLVRVIVDTDRRHDIRRNHTATHLLHAALQKVIGEKARQAGSSVTPDRFRFDFNHHQALAQEQLEQVESIVNQAIASDFQVTAVVKSRREAEAEGAMALFGEKYGDSVRTIYIGEPGYQYSYELCGGTHLDRTSDVGAFLIISESSAAAGVRRIEAVTGRGAYELIQRRFKLMKLTANIMRSAVDDIPEKAEQMEMELASLRKQVSGLKSDLVLARFDSYAANIQDIIGIRLLAVEIPGLDKDALTLLADKFRVGNPVKGICVIATKKDNQFMIVAAVTQDLIKRGVKSGELVGYISRQMGAGGGGAAHLAFGGGKDVGDLPAALASIPPWLEKNLKSE